MIFQQVVCVFGMYGACRTIEFVDLLNEHVKKGLDEIFIVELPQTKTKISRKFVINKEHFYIVQKYRELRPPKTLTKRFFMNYQRGKCVNQVIGKSKFSGMPRRIATFLELPEVDRYTGIVVIKKKILKALFMSFTINFFILKVTLFIGHRRVYYQIPASPMKQGL